jgi:phosphosulfolactate synthase (CoM biosynthesis protein A)
MNDRVPFDAVRPETLEGSTTLEAGVFEKGGRRQMIRKVKEGYRVLSESGRNMGTYATKEEAKKRLRQIEFFKHRKKK